MLIEGFISEWKQNKKFGGVPVENKKTAVVYYSYSGNIRKIVKMIEKLIDVDVFELEPLEDYPKGLKQLIPIAKHEVDNRAGRDIKALRINTKDYDRVILCTPNWGDTLAPPVLTFLKKHDISHAKIVPIVTHQGTGRGQILEDIAKEVGHRVEEGFVDYHKSTTKAKVKGWLEGIL